MEEETEFTVNIYVTACRHKVVLERSEKGKLLEAKLWSHAGLFCLHWYLGEQIFPWVTDHTGTVIMFLVLLLASGKRDTKDPSVAFPIFVAAQKCS